MYFIEFHQKDLAGNLVHTLGDRSVIIVDGRESAASHHDIARREGKKRGYHFYRICKGQSFTRIDKATNIHYIAHE